MKYRVSWKVPAVTGERVHFDLYPTAERAASEARDIDLFSGVVVLERGTPVPDETEVPGTTSGGGAP